MLPRPSHMSGYIVIPSSRCSAGPEQNFVRRTSSRGPHLVEEVKIETTVFRLSFTTGDFHVYVIIELKKVRTVSRFLWLLSLFVVFQFNPVSRKFN